MKLVPHCNFWFEKLLLTILVLGLFACRDNEEETVDHQPSDTVATLKKEDTVQVISTKEIIETFKNVYTHPVKIDTSFDYEGIPYQFSLEHITEKDKSYFIPKKYCEPVGLDRFQFYSFRTKLEIRNNNMLIRDFEIHRDDFKNSVTDSSLARYGALIFPKITDKQSFVVIHHSIAIPLTDIATPVLTFINKDSLPIWRNQVLDELKK